MVIWKKINNDYLVSSTGKVYSLRAKRILKPQKSNDYGHMMVWIYSKPYLLHRIIAETFIPNPNNYPAVHHKDENPGNNSVENIEWCTILYNNNVGNRNKKISNSLTGVKKTLEHARNAAKGHMKKIFQYTKDGTLIKVWESSLEAEANGYCRKNILRCCRGERKTHKGYKWSFRPL